VGPIELIQGRVMAGSYEVAFSPAQERAVAGLGVQVASCVDTRPTNVAELAPCAIHAAEVREFERRVRDPRFHFRALAHDELWAAWSARERPPWLREHAVALRQRYELAV